MNRKNTILAAAVGSLFALNAIGLAQAADDAMGAKEKCYGVAKAGQNDCANLSGSHSCASQAKVDADPGEWKYVAKGTCKAMKGMTAEEAKKAKKQG